MPRCSGKSVCVAAVLAAIGSAAHADDDCDDALEGVYLATIKASDGTFDSRSILSFTEDGHVFITASTQYRYTFGDQMGAYVCTGDYDANAITLNFGYSEAQAGEDIARTDWTFTVDRSGALTGTATLVLYQPVETCDPFNAEATCTGKPPEAFTLTGQRFAPARQ